MICSGFHSYPTSITWLLTIVLALRLLLLPSHEALIWPSFNSRLGHPSRLNSSDPPSTLPVLPPNFPERFTVDFTLYYTPRDDPAMPMPPWPSVYPPDSPFVVGRGKTWYAADLGVAVERYDDFCIPIFEPSSYFPCFLFNYNSTAYFISPAWTGYGPCCVYRDNWSVPHRDFMQQFTHNYARTTQQFGPGSFNQSIDWWTIYETRRDGRRAIFGGYGWASEPVASGFRPPVCFWFVGNEGWAQQIFFNYADSGPETHVLDNFQLPEECHTSQACLYRG